MLLEADIDGATAFLKLLSEMGSNWMCKSSATALSETGKSNNYPQQKRHIMATLLQCCHLVNTKWQHGSTVVLEIDKFNFREDHKIHEYTNLNPSQTQVALQYMLDIPRLWLRARLSRPSG